MKSTLFVLATLIVIPLIYSQDLDENQYSFSLFKLEPKLMFQSRRDITNITITEGSYTLSPLINSTTHIFNALSDYR